MVAEFALIIKLKGTLPDQTRLDQTRLLNKHLSIQTFAQFTPLALLYLMLAKSYTHFCSIQRMC